MQSLPWWSFLGRNRRQVTQETCKMMQHAKLMSSAGLVSAKQEINDAVSELEARPTCIQRVYTNLTRVFNALADHPQVQLAVDSTLATQTRVRLLSELVQIHLRDEEVQWALGRVISLACQVSTRFQCQAGQLEMWNELFAMRSAHPQSIRVQEASLRASEALFRSNEFHITQLRPQQHLDDLSITASLVAPTASLTGDPSPVTRCRGRGFWFSFAYKRAGTCATTTVGQKVVSLKRGMKELLSIYGPMPGNANKRLRHSESLRYDRGRSSSQALPHRSELSSRSSDATHTNSTMRSRDNGLQRVAREGNSLPRHESVYSHQATHMDEKAVVQKEKHRDELLAQRVVSPEQNLNELAARKLISTPRLMTQELTGAPQTDVQYRHALESLPIELKTRSGVVEHVSPDISCTQFNTKSELRSSENAGAGKCGSTSSFPSKANFGTYNSLKSPAHLPLHDAYDKMGPIPPVLGVDRSKRTSKVDTPSTGQNPDFQAHFETPPPWAAHLIKKVQDLQNQVDQLQQEVKTLRGSHEAEPSSRKQPCSSTEKPQRMDTDNSELRMVHAGRAASVDVKSEVIMTGGHTTEKKESADIKILQRIIAGADDDSYVRVKDDPEKRKLIAEYGYISTQIMANQTAIDDALVYVNAIKDVDEVCAAEHHGQIMELVVSVNQEKE
ncbi:hypothetical protein PC117_g426 [Phytophthora cactorum]|uniref:Uncharacterized protein n=4 Tax=Phytophthora cactorum TaxID=29920 RepID=A0A8T1EPQ8_9STRA|nr:hypothetical protein PC117_g426 [Phytophthora cactorum]